eukprot:5343924-Amphidinium_carterae.1
MAALGENQLRGCHASVRCSPSIPCTCVRAWVWCALVHANSLFNLSSAARKPTLFFVVSVEKQFDLSVIGRTKPRFSYYNSEMQDQAGTLAP